MSILALARFGRARALQRRFRCVLASIALLGATGEAFALDFKAGSIEVVQPWSRATPANAKVAGGYVVIRNHGDAPDRLVSATVEVAGRAGIHEMTMKDGVMSMRPLADGVAIPANGEVALTPGAYHLMLLDLKRQLKQGETFAGTLTFEKAGPVDVTFVVEGMGATDAGHQGADHN
ncbi:MAG: copper chaperone PCu(A)C [Methylocella sp.]